MQDIKTTNPIGVSRGFRRHTLLMRALCSALATVERVKSLTYERLSAITDEPTSTLCRWNQGEHAPSVETLLRLFERLPPQRRRELLDQHCRVFPTLDDPHLNHDFEGLRRLQGLLSRSKGITLLEGAPTPVTFLMTAIAHSLGPNRTVRGIGMNAADWLVPAQDISYVDQDLEPLCVRAALKAILLPKTANSLILVNLGPTAFHCDSEISVAAERSHIVIAGVSTKQSVRRFSTVRDEVQSVEVVWGGSLSTRIELHFPGRSTTD